MGHRQLFGAGIALVIAGCTMGAATSGQYGVAVAAPVLGSGKPMLVQNCGIGNLEIASCKLSGRGFHARERVRITYRLMFTALPRVHGHLQGRTYRRTALTGPAGGFQRPALRFSTVRSHEGFRLATTVVGASGDRATITTTLTVN